MNRIISFVSAIACLALVPSNRALATESASATSSRGQAASRAVIPPGRETGLERETILEQEIALADDGCRLSRQLHALRQSSRSGGTDRTFDVSPERASQYDVRQFGGAVIYERRSGVVRVTVSDPSAVRYSQTACGELDRATAANEQFRATVGTQAFVCALTEIRNDVQSNNWQFDFSRTNASYQNLERLEEYIEGLVAQIGQAPYLRVSQPSPGKAELLRDLRSAQRHVSRALSYMRGSRFGGIELHQNEIQPALNTAITLAQRAHAAVTDRTPFPQGCDRNAKYVWDLQRRGSDGQYSYSAR
ncbi:MAG: hypothetical protein V4760_00515 [Bdellovibrionota bacterium]